MSKRPDDDFFADDSVPEPPPEPPASGPVEEPPQYTRKKRESTVPDITLDGGLPAAVDAEKTILGAVMLDNQALKEITFQIQADDFSLDSHRRIMLRMSELWDEKKPIDIVTLANRLNLHKEVEAVGGVAYLASLTEGLPRRPVIDEYLRIVRDKSILRQIMMVNSSTVALAADQSQDSLGVLEYLERNLQSIKERARVLARGANEQPFFVGYRTFVANATPEIEWTVEGIIQAEGNGLIIGDSGASKSMLAYDLALHLVSGSPWFHHSIPKRRKVGLVSREDAPGLCQNRMKRMIAGGDDMLRQMVELVDLEECLYFNTRAQRETWTLQSEPDIQDIIAAVQERGIEFIVIDVFRTVWEGDENDNQETARVLAAAKRIGTEGKCQVAIIHHLSKSDKGTIFDRARGGGINGWKEWGIGVSVDNPDADPKNHIRKLHFHTKADVSCPHIFYKIGGDEYGVRLIEVDDAPAQEPLPRSKKKKGPEQQSMDYEE